MGLFQLHFVVWSRIAWRGGSLSCWAWGERADRILCSMGGQGSLGIGVVHGSIGRDWWTGKVHCGVCGF